jgi:hypothetical protein
MPLFCREFIHEPLPFDATNLANKSQMAKIMDNFLAFFTDLSKDRPFVHTSGRRIGGISWNQLKITVTLHQK